MNASDASGNRCPSCDSVIPENAVLCVACGFNLQTGTHLATIVERGSSESAPQSDGSDNPYASPLHSTTGKQVDDTGEFDLTESGAQKAEAVAEQARIEKEKERLRISLSNLTQSKLIVMDAAQREVLGAEQKLKLLKESVDASLEKADASLEGWMASVDREVERWDSSVDEFRAHVEMLASAALMAVKGAYGSLDEDDKSLLNELSDCHRKIKQLHNVIEVGKDREAELAKQKMDATKAMTLAESKLIDAKKELEGIQAQSNQAKLIAKLSSAALGAKHADERKRADFNARYADRTPTSTPAQASA